VTKWTPDELQSLFGQEETIRLEFKSGRLLEGATERAADSLSKSVSAFANTEGGLLIIGIKEEKRGKVRVAASEFEGVPAEDWPIHRLQQLIESNVHPPLMGLRIHPIRLTSVGEARVGFVVEVPKGRTAHQARDCRYYGRSEQEAKPLRDLDIRLRMDRGKAVRAALSASVYPLRSAAELKQNQIDEHRTQLQSLKDTFSEQGVDLSSPKSLGEPPVVTFAKDLGAGRPHLVDTDQFSPRFRCNEWAIDFVLTNSGERTIRDFEVQIITTTEQCGISGYPSVQPAVGFWSEDAIVKLRKLQIQRTLRDCQDGGRRRIWPGSAVQVGQLIVLVPELMRPVSGMVFAKWTIFLDDVLPISSEIDLGDQIATSLQGNVTGEMG
jgi:hypothetical protein